MHRSTGFAVALASITSCGARAEGGVASASEGAASQSGTASSGEDADSSSGAASIGSADGSGGTEGFVPLAIDLPADKVPYCVTADETVLDYVVPGTGDGSPITCSRMQGLGNGTLPETVSVDPDTCGIVGEPPASRYGTWAVIVKATQGDVEVWVPYCVTQNQQPAGHAVIEVAAGELSDTALHPLHGTFDADAPLAAGGSDDPLFRVIDPTRCGESCSFSYQFFASASPFVVDEGPIIIDAMIVAENGAPVGLSHGIDLAGPPIGGTAPDLADRPWVFGIDLDYCLAPVAADCDAAMRPETAARFRYSVVMSPQ